MKRLAVVTMLLLLAGCGGDGGDNGVEMPDDEIMELQSDSRVIRLVGILDRTDTLLVPSVHVGYSLSVLGVTTPGSLIQEITCSEDRCGSESAGVALGLTDLVDLSTKVSVSEANLQSRDDGFDTASIRGNLDASDIGEFPVEVGELSVRVTVTEIPEALGYGFWGEHGMAGLFLADGPVSGQSNGIPLDGDLTAVVPFALGDTSITNPGGSGSATWTGLAEAVSTRAFRRRTGTATLTIPDLSQPAVTIGIDIDGNPIDGPGGAPGWTDVPLEAGRFESGTVGKDYLEGNFYGVEHSEAYGVFHTKAFTGAFGAKRQEESE